MISILASPAVKAKGETTYNNNIDIDPIDLKTKYGISSGNLSKSSVKVIRQSFCWQNRRIAVFSKYKKYSLINIENLYYYRPDIYCRPIDLYTISTLSSVVL